jgi:Pyruvate phosphate dikinase, AMP/ATP-binding domain
MTLINSNLFNYFLDLLHPFTSSTAPRVPAPAPSSPGSYGKKHENLVRLHLAQAHSREKYVTPLPFGLTTEEVEPYLRKKTPAFFMDWQELKACYEQDSAHFFTDQTTLDLIEQVKNYVITAFADPGAPWKARLNQWLKSDSYFMVRSSGSEDGKAANAGGNLSLSYVRPEKVASLMGEVIASYFDKRSLQNQSKGGANPFAACPLSVTVQELIGEPMGGEKDPANIPVSAVLFSNEPLYIGNEEFRMMRLSATRGHGEGVVGNEGIATDTFIVLQSRVHPDTLYIVDNISSKPERLAPVDGKLQPVPNPRELIDAPSVDKAMLQRLFNIGIEVEQNLFAGKPADIELVIKKNVIHLVQAREVNRPLQTTPRYLNLEDCSAKTQAMKVLIPGHMQAEALDDPAQILVVDTLEEAQFLEGNFKLILVKNDEPANSHPMINFSERGIHVFYSPKGFDPPTDGEKIMVCPQQGIVACGDPSSFKFKEGYIEHPAPIQFSSQPLPFLAPNKELVEKLNPLIRQLKTENCTEIALKALEDLKTFPALEEFNRKVTQAKAFSEPTQHLQKLFQNTLEELGESLKKGSRLENLFYIKAVKNLLTDSPFSVLSLTQVLDQTIAFEQKASDRLSKEVVIETLEPKTKAHWEAFLLDVDKTASEAEIKSFQRLLEALGSLKPLWLTFYFAPRQGKLSSQELLQELLNAVDEVSFNFIDQLKHQPFRYFKEQAFIDNFKNSCPLARIVALRYLFQAVDSQDKKLKSLQLSSQPLNTKILAFKKELTSYLELMKVVAKELVGEGKFHLPETNLANYLLSLDSTIQRIYQKDETLNLLKPSEFNVAVAKLGSGTLFTRQLPNTLEDLFTLSHQNLLACIALLYKQNLPSLETLDLHGLLKKATEQVASLGKIDLIGIEQQGEALILSYNVPQRNHSSTFQLQFKKGALHFSAQMLGQNRTRWTTSQDFIHLLNQWKILPYEKLVQRGDILDITWSIKDADQMKKACGVLSTIYEFALEGEFQRFTLCLSDLYKNNELVLSNLLTTMEETNPVRAYETEKMLLSDLIKNAAFKDAVNQHADRLLAFVKKDLKSSDFQTSRKALELTVDLVEQEIIGARNLLPDVLQFIQKILSSSFSETLTKETIPLFNRLFEQNKISLEEVRLIIEKLVADPSPTVRSAIVDNLAYLPPSSLGLTSGEVMNFIKQLFHDQDIRVLRSIDFFLLVHSNAYIQLLAFYKSNAQRNTPGIDWAQGIHELESMVTQYEYHSPLALLYRGILMGMDEAEIKKCFATMPAKDRDLVYELVSGSVKELKENNIFNDMDVFNDAVQQALIEKFRRLSEEEKNIIYHKIRSEQEKFWKNAWSIEWAKVHCEDDLLLLASALP